MFIYSLLYLVIPFLIFSIGFLRWYIAIPVVVMTIYSCYRVNSNIRGQLHFSAKIPKVGYFVIFAFSLLLCWQSGIGSFWSQTEDFEVKNPLLNDLCLRSWPLFYDLSEQSQVTQNLIGSDKVAFVYYLFYYLPAACVGKIFGLLAARIALLLWSAIGSSLVLLWILNWLNFEEVTLTKIAAVLFLFFAFAGLDVIADVVQHLSQGNIPNNWAVDLLSHHTEIWCSKYKDATYFTTYSGTAWNLTWVFNQCIPSWLIVLLILQHSSFKHVLFYFSFILLYSPWATLGLFPIVAFVWIRKFINNKALLKSSLSFENICFPLLLLLIVGSYYLSKGGATGESGPWWHFVESSYFWTTYLFFVVIEVGIYFIILWKKNKSDYFFQAIVVVLLLIPFYKITPLNDFLMRGSLPGLFILFLFWIEYIFAINVKKSLLIIPFVVITTLCSIQSYSNEIGHFFKTKEIRICNKFSSFDNIIDKDGEYQIICDRQFFNHEYRESFFYKYLSK